MYEAPDKKAPNGIYKEIFKEKVSFVFTVNLKLMEIKESDNTFEIILPDVVCSDPKIDVESYETVVNNSDGSKDKDSINDRSDKDKQLMKELKEDIDNSFHDKAKEAAIRQVDNLVLSITGKKAIIKFQGE